jgi:hypothetical protein
VLFRISPTPVTVFTICLFPLVVSFACSYSCLHLSFLLFQQCHSSLSPSQVSLLLYTSLLSSITRPFFRSFYAVVTISPSTPLLQSPRCLPQNSPSFPQPQQCTIQHDVPRDCSPLPCVNILIVSTDSATSDRQMGPFRSCCCCQLHQHSTYEAQVRI